MTPEDISFCQKVLVAGNHEAKYNTFEIVERILDEKIEGDFAEAGVMAGGHIAVMDYVLRKHGQTRVVHAFDSFDGIPQATEEDDPDSQKVYGIRRSNELMKSTGVSRVDVPGFKYFMNIWDARIENIRIHEGWFQNYFSLATFAYFPNLAFLRIDVDLVESVKLCLKYLYPLVITGGYVVFDDWGMIDSPNEGIGCPPNRRVLFEMTGLKPESFNHVIGNSGTVWFRKP